MLPSASSPTAGLRPTAPARYGLVAMLLHGVMAVGILASLALGLYMADLPFSPRRVQLYNWHKWAGVTLLVLAAVRLLWRLWQPPPPVWPMPTWQQHAAHVTHLALYALFFAVPLLGWAYSSAAGFPIVWFGVVPLPDWVPVDRDWAESLQAAHRYSAYALAALVALHVAAALKHHWVDRDGVLARMGGPAGRRT